MSKHETPLTRRFWQELGAGTLVHEFQAIRRTSKQGNREIDGVIILGTSLQEVTGKERGPWQSVEGRDIICVQTKAATLSVHLIEQAYFSKELLLRHGRARTVQTVALCTADSLTLRTFTLRLSRSTSTWNRWAMMPRPDSLSLIACRIERA